MKNVIADYRDQECFMSFEDYHEKTSNLDRFIIELIAVRTQRKWSTWGREYIEIPVEVMAHFGVKTNLPLVAYRNYIMCSPYDFCYSGAIFQGDAAWFDYYSDMGQAEILASSSYAIIKAALENTDPSKQFLDFFDSSRTKWTIVPIWNPELAAIAAAKNSSIK